MMPIQPNEGLPVEAAPAGVNRRALLGRVGAGATMGALAAGGVALGSAPAQAQSITTADVFNFALNLEYLEAEFYLRAVGQTLQARDITGAGFPGDTNGGVSGGRAVQFQSQAIRLYAEKIASDELAHVRLIRSVLGSAAVARPQIDLDTAFTVLARSAGLIGAGVRAGTHCGSKGYCENGCRDRCLHLCLPLVMGEQRSTAERFPRRDLMCRCGPPMSAGRD